MVFSSLATRDQVNAWYAQATCGLIAEMLDRLSPQTRFVIASAVALKGKWLVAFDPADTRPRRFLTAAGSGREMPMMAHSGRTLLYRETRRFQAVRLAYAGAAFEMIVAVPRLALETGGEIRAQLARDVEFGAALRADADLGAIAEEPLQVDRVVHRALLRMDEEGTEAAGATAVIGTRTALDRPVRPFRMIVDRPYLVAIGHAAPGALLFVGHILDPLGRAA
jgi:serine protease inhibitor